MLPNENRKTCVVLDIAPSNIEVVPSARISHPRDQRALAVRTLKLALQARPWRSTYSITGRKCPSSSKTHNHNNDLDRRPFQKA
jgi:hypothetical protein